MQAHNSFPAKDGISTTMSPNTIVTVTSFEHEQTQMGLPLVVQVINQDGGTRHHKQSTCGSVFH